MSTVKAYAAASPQSELAPITIERREVQERDVAIDILYCGVCHSDIHAKQNDWGNAKYPIVPGHEIIGRVVAVGPAVTNHKIGDIVGVGCMVDSCLTCSSCDANHEQFCENGSTSTYNSLDKFLGGHTFGGYSKHIVVKDHFVLKIPTHLPLQEVAPLLCAGITTYSPLKRWNVKKGDVVGVIGLGGLGHMAVKFAKALGAHVVMITSSPSKAQDAKQLGADEVLITSEKGSTLSRKRTFDFLLNTIPVGHDLNPYLQLLKPYGTMCMVGAIEPLEKLHGANLIVGNKNLVGSLIGGIAETQEMLNFCGEHNITCDVELIDMQDVNTAFERVQRNDVKYRFVIDLSSL